MTTTIAPSTLTLTPTPPHRAPACACCWPSEHTIGGHDHSGTLIADYKRWCDLVLLTLRRYALDDHVLSDVTDPSVYWARLDNIVVTWILDTLSPELYEIVQEPTETARQSWLMIEAQFLNNSELHVLQFDVRFWNHLLCEA
jgi:hypothetical protein